MARDRLSVDPVSAQSLWCPDSGAQIVTSGSTPKVMALPLFHFESALVLRAIAFRKGTGMRSRGGVIAVQPASVHFQLLRILGEQINLH